MWVCVCVHTKVYVSMCVCMSECVYALVCIYACPCVYIYVCACALVFIHVFAWAHMYRLVYTPERVLYLMVVYHFWHLPESTTRSTILTAEGMHRSRALGTWPSAVVRFLLVDLLEKHLSLRSKFKILFHILLWFICTLSYCLKLSHFP